MTRRVFHGGVATQGRVIAARLAVLVVLALAATSALADEPSGPSLDVRDFDVRDLYCEPPVLRCRSGCVERGFDGELYVADVGGRARLGFTAYAQIRADWGKRTEAPAGEGLTTSRFAVERFRLIFDGTVTEHWSYHVRLGVNDGGDFDVGLAELTWKPTSRLSVTLGEQFVAVSREDWMFAEDLLTTEYSANDNVFGTGASYGLQAIYQGCRDRLYAGISSGDLGPRTEFLGAVATADAAVTARYERQLLTTDWSTWDDVIGRVGRSRGVLLGAGAGYARVSQEGASGDQLLGTVDASYSWRTGHALAYGSLRHLEPDDAAGCTDYGFLVQAGQFVAPTVQVYGRYEIVAPGSQGGSLEVFQSATIGCSYLPFRWTNRAKATLELAHAFTGIDRTLVPSSRALGFLPSSDPQTYVRLQVLLGL